MGRGGLHLSEPRKSVHRCVLTPARIAHPPPQEPVGPWPGPNNKPTRQPGRPCPTSGWGHVAGGRCFRHEHAPAPRARSPRRPAVVLTRVQHPHVDTQAAEGPPQPPSMLSHTTRKAGAGTSRPRPQASAPAIQPGSAAHPHVGKRAGAGGSRVLSSCEPCQRKSREARNTTYRPQDLRGWHMSPGGGGATLERARVSGTHRDIARGCPGCWRGHARLGIPLS